MPASAKRIPCKHHHVLHLAGLRSEGEADADLVRPLLDGVGHQAGLMARIEQSLGVKLPLAALFEAPTVERLAEVVHADRHQTTGRRSCVSIRVARAVRCSWLIRWVETSSPTWSWRAGSGPSAPSTVNGQSPSPPRPSTEYPH
jgi:hypothetical protein